MATDFPPRRKFFPAVMLFVLLALPLCAQEKGYYFDTSGGELRFYQRLAWTGEGNENTLFFEVVIQKDDGTWQDFMRETTKEAFIDVSLPPGKYRYSVIPQGLLDRPGEESEWRVFEVLPAWQPEIKRFWPAAFYLDKTTERALIISGLNLLEESEIYLRNNNRVLIPAWIQSLNGAGVSLHFTEDQLLQAEGRYEIYVRNPGGLETSRGRFTVKYQKPVDVLIGISWKPLVPIYGETERAFGQNLFIGGSSVYLDLFPSKQRPFYVGAGIMASLNFMESYTSVRSVDGKTLFGYNNNGYHTVLAQAGVNLLLQKRFFNRMMALTFRTGPGYAFLSGNSGVENSVVPDAIPDFLNMGVSYFWLIYDIFYIEAGIDYACFFAQKPFGDIRPWLGVGWKL